MFLDKSLSIALLISIVLHALIFLPLPALKKSLVERNPPIRITYLMPQAPEPRKIQIERKSIKREPIKIEKTVKVQKQPVKRVVKVNKPSVQRTKIEIPPELPKEKEALYLDYYQRIREKIRRAVINNYPHYIACGEVRLYFVLKSDGNLKELNIAEANSSPNRRLKEVAQKSIRQAAPFSPFPKDLQQGQLSFNVIVSFELEN